MSEDFRAILEQAVREHQHCEPCQTPKGCALFGCKDKPVSGVSDLLKQLRGKIKAVADAYDMDYDGDMGPSMQAQMKAGIDLDDFVMEHGRDLVSALDALL